MGEYNQHLSSLFRSFNQSIAIVLLLLIQGPSFAADVPQAGNPANGSKAWADNCTRCHNMRSPNDLTDEQWITSVFHMRIRAGLTGQETRDILSFLQASNSDTSLQALPTSTLKVAVNETTTPTDGKSVYEASCVACHGANGKGTLPSVPDFTQQGGRLSQPKHVLLVNILNGVQSAGSPMPMPARGGNPLLTDEELSATLDYLLLTFKP